jgi:hypothetical protein
MQRIRNSSYRLLPHQERALDAMAKERAADLRSQENFLASARPTASEKRLIRKMQSDWLKIDAEVHRQTITQLNKARIDRLALLRKAPTGSSVVMSNGGNVPMPIDDNFWWIQTEWYTGHGIDAQYLEDGLHFFGQAIYDGDERIVFSVGALADFGLDPNRRPTSDSGRWRSTPPINLSGEMWGSTGFYNPIWAADDKWAKCFLFLRQTLLQYPTDGSGSVTIGDQYARPALINEENSNRVGQKALLGSMDMPTVETSLYDPDLDIIARLEIRFDIELEGSSDISFNSTTTQPSVSNAMVLRTLQWPLIPV